MTREAELWALLSDPAARESLGLGLSEGQAQRLLMDDTLFRAYIGTWGSETFDRRGNAIPAPRIVPAAAMPQRTANPHVAIPHFEPSRAAPAVGTAAPGAQFAPAQLPPPPWTERQQPVAAAARASAPPWAVPSAATPFADDRGPTTAFPSTSPRVDGETAGAFAIVVIGIALGIFAYIVPEVVAAILLAFLAVAAGHVAFIMFRQIRSWGLWLSLASMGLGYALLLYAIIVGATR